MCQKDKQYIGLCLDGEPEAFRHLVFRYQGRLVSYLTGRLGGGQAAAEAAQETFVRAYFALRRLKKPESFFSWLFGIADRVAKEHWRTQRRDNEIANSSARGRTDHHVKCDYDLERAVADLAEPYRGVILLRYYGGMSCAEVAERLGIALGTVTSRLSRAYTMLRESLARTDLTQQNSEAQS
ncbi:MAG: sigma-70 family RNA polymerase sigma factor [Candidatus Hydrogenedentes bacterium]|nr:sigma-70 family RNA polymerase sigma factor [Candidatus Hydrogenedentota bacterium]